MKSLGLIVKEIIFMLFEKKWLLGINVIFALSFGVLSFMYPSQINWNYRLAIFIGLVALPFISTYLLNILLNVIYLNHIIYNYN